MKGLEMVTDGVKQIISVMKDAVVGAANYADEILALSTKTGVSTKTLQEFSAVSELLNVDLNTMTGSLSKLTKSMSSAKNGTEEAAVDLKKLQTAQTNLKNSMLSVESAQIKYNDAVKKNGAASSQAKQASINLQKAQNGLAQAQNNVEAASVAVGGKVNEMAESFKKLGVEVTDSSGELRDNEEVFWESIDALGKMSNETERDALSMQLFGKSAQELNPLIKTGSEGFNELTQKAHEMGLVMDDETLTSLGKLDDAMQTWNGTIQGLTNNLVANLAPELSNIVSVASETAGAFGNLISSIGKDDGSFEENLENLKTSIGNFFQVFSESETIQKILGWGLILSGAIIALAPLIGAAVSGLMALVTGAIAAWPIALGAVLIGGLILFWPQISGFFVNLWNGLSEFFGNLWTNISDWFGEVWENIKNWFVETAINASTKTEEFIDGIVKWFQELPGKISEFFSNIWTNIKNWFFETAINLSEKTEEFVDGFMKWFKDIPENIKNIGKNLVKGLWDGINGMVNWVKDKIKGFANSVMGWFKNLFGISSPSKLFRDQIGKNLALGLGDGFTDEMKVVSKEMTDAIPTSFDAEIIPNIDTDFADASLTQNVNDPVYLVGIFQKALQGMAFEIDGDKMGQMVISKVERVVFA